MNIFEEVKSSVSARAVIENYGLKVGRNGMACCPFHNDKHPSMKVDDTHYHCFGCGAHGDVIGYVAQMYSISQYEAACKIVDDFHLLIDTNHEFSEDEKRSFEKVQEQKMALQTGSYLIELDENGDVENYTVTTHGTEFSAPSGDAQEKKIVYNNSVRTRDTTNDLLDGDEINPNGVTETEPDYMEAMAVLSAGMRRI